MAITKPVKQTVTIGDLTYSFEVGHFAKQATAAVLVTVGETVVHVTVVSGSERPDLGYFPLTVEYQEKLYSAGIIKGSRWVKREGRPTDEEILRARMIDRSIRPLFPKSYKKEVQVVATVLSYDKKNQPHTPALLATSAALSISSIPWQGPIAAIQISDAKLDLVASGSKDAIVMVEASAKEISETKALEALKLAHTEIKTIIVAIDKLVKSVGAKKETVVEPKIDADAKKQVLAKVDSSLKDLIKQLKNDAETKNLSLIKQAAVEELADLDSQLIKEIIDDQFKKLLRDQLLTKKIRPDGRQPDEIRPLSAKIGLLPRTHGSGMFQRGSTQCLTIATLGSPSLEQWIEGIDGQETKRYLHHYIFPPFSVGETGRMGWPSRREIGHGTLAERSLLPVIPDENTFPYTIRVVSEIMSSNGSTSMASVCGSTLALMDAGVPIKKPVGGIAMGLMINDKTHLVLTDILGLEDYIGDMDFKVAGTKDGITGLQMDIKVSGVSFAILEVALAKAKQARLKILDTIISTIAKPKDKVSVHAPKIATLTVPQDKIGEVIGPGGRMIRQIIKDTESEVDVNDEGRVVISGLDADKVQKALTWIDGLTRDIQIGEEFDGTVSRIESFGVFVEFLPGRSGMVHISKLSTEYVADAKQVVQIGDTLHVRVVEIDDMGRLNLTALTKEQEKEAQQSRPDRRPPQPQSHHRHRRSSNRY